MRIIREIEIEGKKAWALFDTGAFNTYIVRQLLEGVPLRPIPEPFRVALGGETMEVKEHCSIGGRIEGYGFAALAIPINNLGEVDGKVINAIIGASTMERWEISLHPKDGTLDLGGLKRREFTEY